jgi:8-oxo-dGTP pyrophosphatase MutT (NUDIX family)
MKLCRGDDILAVALTSFRNAMIGTAARIAGSRFCWHRLGIIAFIGVSLGPSPIAATTDFSAAGVLLIAYENGSSLVFLGKDRYRPWYEMLAGSRDVVPVGNNESRLETAYETALRECIEESRGYLKSEYLLSISNPAEFIRDGSFVFFRAGAKMFSVDDVRRMQIPADIDASPFREMVDYAWVSAEAVVSSSDSFVFDHAGRRVQIRPSLKLRLLRARAAGWL